ncbi:hypothetical protein T4A_10532 [Trichinella pseudospiralis]|uniref:Uncharacterized protein n=1 Tax=Trichinella pseudospiralis TaxID=6337 RepID=A0A0V1E576_TRIPS|nr:hypothetical protein T4A_10532 [Trichinella pseudospiralis]
MTLDDFFFVRSENGKRPNSRQKSGTEWLDLYRSTRSQHGTVAAALMEAG